MVFDLDKDKMNSLKNKISQSEKFDFTKDEKDLMFKMTGFDLFNNSELRAILIFFFPIGWLSTISIFTQLFSSLL